MQVQIGSRLIELEAVNIPCHGNQDLSGFLLFFFSGEPLGTQCYWPVVRTVSAPKWITLEVFSLVGCAMEAPPQCRRSQMVKSDWISGYCHATLQ